MPNVECRSRLGALDAETSNLEPAHKGQWITPKRLVYGGLATAGIVFIAILSRVVSHPDNQSSVTPAASNLQDTSSQQSPSGDSVSNSQNADRQDNQSTVAPVASNPQDTSSQHGSSGDSVSISHTEAAVRPNRIEIELPPELLRKEQWPDLPLMQMPTQLAKEKTGFDPTSYVFFSPNGRFVLVLHYRSHDRKQDVRLWNVSNGEQFIANSPECNYFSFPAAFSPDELSIACLDGDFLRIWSLKASPAVLVQSLRLTRPSPQYGGEAAWSSLLWSKDDTILLRLRTEEYRERCYQVLRQTGGNSFSPFGQVRTVKGTFKGQMGWFADTAVSPDGRYWAIAADPDPRSEGDPRMVIHVMNTEADSKIQEMIFPKCHHATQRFPSQVLAIRSDDQKAWSDPTSCLEFSPDGQFLLVATVDDAKKLAITFLKTSTCKKVAVLDGDDLQESRRQGDGFRAYSFAPDGKQMAGLSVKATRTSRGELEQRVAIVFDVETAKRTQQIELGDEFMLDDRMRFKRASQEAVTFSRDGKTLVVGAMVKNGWNKQKNHSETSWAIASYELRTATKRFVVSGVLADNRQGGQSLALSPGGDILVTEGGECSTSTSLQVWDVPHLAKLRADLDQGDALWKAHSHSEAFKHYCSLLADKMCWFCGDDLPRVWSRCVDAYAEEGNVPSGRKLVAYAQERKIALAPETPQGKRLVEDFVAEQAEVRRRESKQASEAKERRVAEVRARNQKNSVAGRRLTKREFIEKLKEVMDRGRIDNLVTQGIFENYSFQDVFGDPASNVEWVDSQRLVQYRCSDGSIQLTVIYAGATTILSGINQY